MGPQPRQPDKLLACGSEKQAGGQTWVGMQPAEQHLHFGVTLGVPGEPGKLLVPSPSGVPPALQVSGQKAGHLLQHGRLGRQVRVVLDGVPHRLLLAAQPPGQKVEHVTTTKVIGDVEAHELGVGQPNAGTCLGGVRHPAAARLLLWPQTEIPGHPERRQVPEKLLNFDLWLVGFSHGLHP